MIEYWLQKKTLGGWSHVTRYEDLLQAKRNYDNCSKGDSGYSWRIMKCEVIEEKLLDDNIEVEEVQEPVKSAWDDVKSSGWGGQNPIVADIKSEHGMSGKVWLINHVSKVRMRANAIDVEGFIATGLWERGGPKTPFRT